MKILKFSANWCAPCKAMQVQIDRLNEDGKLNTEIEHIDIEKNPDVAKEYGIRSIPTLIKLQGKMEIARSVGSLSNEKLLDFLS
jgi:thiol-disulfide isomerase/thioredoxin